MWFNKLLISSVFIAIAYGNDEKNAKILSYYFEPTGHINPVDHVLYHYNFKTENGIDVNQLGRPKNQEGEEGLTVAGHYSYTAPDGTFVEVHYIADKDGYRVVEKPPPPSLGGGGGVSAHCLGSLIGCNIG